MTPPGTKGLVALGDLAATQFGVVTRAQALDVMSVDGLRQLCGAGVLVRMHRGVYRFRATPASFRQRAWAACAAIGAPVAVSHQAAAQLWQVPGLRADGRIELTVPPERRAALRGAPVHRRLLPAVDVTERWGIPVTTPARLLVDLSGTVPAASLGRIADELVRSGHLTLPQLQRRLTGGEVLPRHRQVALSGLVEQAEKRSWAAPGASVAEDWVFDAIVGAGLPVPVRNYRLELENRWREIDLAYPQWLIAVEYDGWGVHSDRTHFHSDREKVALLQLAGWLVLQVTSQWTPETVVARVGQAIAQRSGAAGGGVA